MVQIRLILMLLGVLLIGGTKINSLSEIEETKVNQCIEVYSQKMQELMIEDSEITFELVYIDGDNIPELAAGRQGYCVSLFTYKNKELVTVMEYAPYGAMGNAGYEYSPYDNVMRNYNSDYAGAVRWLDYWMINENGEYQDFYDEALCASLFNNIYDMKDGVEFNEDIWYYFYGDKQITEEEYEAYLIDGEYQYIELGKTNKEIMEEMLIWTKDRIW